MAVALILSFAMGLFIFFIYKKSYCGLMYSASFGATLVALTLITTFLILAVTSNVVLSLGMVGALSIVRFQNSNQRTYGHRISFLEHCGRHRTCCRFHTAGGLRKCIYRACPPDILRQEKYRTPLYSGSSLRDG